MIYDPEGDTLTVHFREPNVADESEMTDEGVIMRYDAAGELIGMTILHASQQPAA
jgi:uncharacterized protein YuzE